MALRIVSHLIAQPRPKYEATPIFKFGVKFSFKAEQYVPLGTPVISRIAATVLDHTHSNGAEISRPPVSNTLFSGMLGLFNFGPVRNPKRYIFNSQNVSSCAHKRIVECRQIIFP